LIALAALMSIFTGFGIKSVSPRAYSANAFLGLNRITTSKSLLGLQVVIEDYVHSGVKFAALIAMRLGCFAVAAAGIAAALRIAFGG
jgi:hypothetical protein